MLNFTLLRLTLPATLIWSFPDAAELESLKERIPPLLVRAPGDRVPTWAGFRIV